MNLRKLDSSSPPSLRHSFMTTQAKIYLVRHGETDANRKRIIQGHLDIPLSEIGLEQAALVASALRVIKFDIALSSDLSRATAVSTMTLM